MLSLFNSLTKQIEPFRPLKGRTVRVYACGPTVYDFAHVGNLRTYLFEDVMRRVLVLNGLRVQHVMNITDVGHLTDNADAGEDKMELSAGRQQKTAKQVSAFYTKAFLRDLSRLNILSANEMPRATGYIAEQIALVQLLEERGFTYTTSDGVYFDTAKFSAYGEAFGGQALAEKEAGARVEVRAGKKHPQDFALWKLSYPRMATDQRRMATDNTDGVGATRRGRPSGRAGTAPRDTSEAGTAPRRYDIPKRQQEWPSPWGVGFPGWHLECSAMSHALLGQPFDIHCGGVDHIPVHHTNEIAQSEAAYGVPLAATWLHGAFLTVDGGRMGKSEGNFITVDEIVMRGFDPLAYRLLVLGAHYRSSLNFTWEALGAAAQALEHLRDRCRALPKPPARVNAQLKSAVRALYDRFLAVVNDDLDTPKALALVWDTLRSRTEPAVQSALIAYADDVLGLGVAAVLGKPIRIPVEVKKLAADREHARVTKDWARADVLRAQLEALGWRVEDTKDGPVVKRRPERL